MFQLVLRFFGRFVYAEPLVGSEPFGILNAIAINMGYNAAVPAGVHRVVMAAPRKRVLMPGSRPADSMVMSSGPVHDCEHGLWFIDDHQAFVGHGRDFRWSNIDKAKDSPVFANLRELSHGQTFDQSALYSRGVDLSAASAIIQINTGVGTALQIDKGKRVDLVRLGEQDTVLASPDPGYKFADYLEVVVDNGKSAFFTMQLGKRGGGCMSSVTFELRGDLPTVVTFSNLCSQPHRTVDEEFAALYDVLKTPPPVPDRRVTKERRTEGFLEDCYTGGYVDYRIL